jgi:RNA polymerase sigma factor (sigma-70 family)
MPGLPPREWFSIPGLDRLDVDLDAIPDRSPRDIKLAICNELALLLMQQLPDRERTIIELRNGLDGYGPRSLLECGRIFGITQERVRQIEARGLRMLREKMAGWGYIRR